MKIGVIGAMDVEVARLRVVLARRADTAAAGMEFSEGEISGVPCVIVQSGVGKVNAALCAQVLASVFGVTHVLNTGVAGSLDAAIDICDIVVSTDCVYHDVDATNFGYEPGQVPGMPAASFAADPALRAAVLAAAASAAPNVSAHEGRIASGDQFIRDDVAKRAIVRQFGARCCEMEGAAIAHACTVNAIPFVIIRAISDKADGSREMMYPVFERIAADECARIVVEFFRSLP